MPATKLDTAECRLLDELAEAAAGDSQPKRLRDVLGVQEDVLEAMECYAHELYRLGRLERAGTIIEGILALDHTRSYAYLLVGDIALQNGAWSDAARCFGAAINFSDEPTALLFGKLGEAHVRAGQLKEGVAALRRAVDAGRDTDKYVRRSRAILETIVESVDAVASEN